MRVREGKNKKYGNTPRLNPSTTLDCLAASLSRGRRRRVLLPSPPGLLLPPPTPPQSPHYPAPCSGRRENDMELGGIEPYAARPLRASVTECSFGFYGEDEIKRLSVLRLTASRVRALPPLFSPALPPTTGLFLIPKRARERLIPSPTPLPSHACAVGGNPCHDPRVPGFR